MKKIVGAILWTIVSWSAVQACDICGCGAGSYYIGILPEFNAKIIGVRYRSNSLQTHLGPGGTTSYLTTAEQYRTAELWGGWTFKNKLRVMAYLPFSFNSKTNQEGTDSKSGPGDMAVQGFYRVLGKKKVVGGEGRLLVQDLWIGGGVKLPTGKYVPADKDETGKNANLFQLGTASIDFMLTAMYDVRIQDAGLNLTGSYKLNTTNRHDYYYGNKWSGSAQFYYKFRIKKALTIAPNAGISYESAVQDLDGGYPVYNSGGSIAYGTLGAEMSGRKLAFGGNWQPPLAQHLAQGAVRANNKIMLHFSFLF